MQICNAKELSRLTQMSVFENELRSQGFVRIAGVDEAGRGPLAGPVVAAACILPARSFFNRLNDSKKLSAAQRDLLYVQITNNPAVMFGVGIVEACVIDEINILQATFLAMQKALAALPVLPDYVLVDGNRLPKIKGPAKAIVEGDGRSISIAAASIIAKVTRDRIMEEFDTMYPGYGFKQHKGYGTKLHMEALQAKGLSPIHRRSFASVDLSG